MKVFSIIGRFGVKCGKTYIFFINSRRRSERFQILLEIKLSITNSNGKVFSPLIEEVDFTEFKKILYEILTEIG